MKLWLLLGSGVVATVMGASSMLLMSSGEPTPAVKAVRGEIVQFVDEQGKTRLQRTFLLTTPFAGRVEPASLQVGDEVKRHQILAQLSPDELKQEVAQAQALVDRFKAAVRENNDTQVETIAKQQSEAFVESMQHTVEAAEQRMTSGRKRVQVSDAMLARARRLRTTGAKSREDLDLAELSAVESQVNYRENVLTWEASKSVLTATAMLPKIIQQWIQRKSLTAQVIQQQQAEAEAALRQARLRAEQGQIKSPIDGVVLKRQVESERYLGAGETLLSIGQLDHLQIEADVLSLEVVRIRPGDEVEIYGPAVGREAGKGVRGVVRRIHPAGFTKVSSLGVEQQRVKVVLDFAEGVLVKLQNERSLGVGYRVRVRFITDRASNAVLIPRTALVNTTGQQGSVFVVRNGKAGRQTVTVGLLNDDQAQIIKGLKVGDVVVLAPEAGLTDGAAVDAKLK